MNELIATTTLFKGKSYEIKNGDTFYWQHSIYSENWQSWTIALYYKVDDNFKFLEKVTQRDFTREIQRMNELSKV